MNITLSVSNTSAPTTYTPASSAYVTNTVNVNVTGIPANTRKYKWGWSYGSNQYSTTTIVPQLTSSELSYNDTIDIQCAYIKTASSTTFTYFVTCYYESGSTAATKTAKTTVTLPSWLKPVVNSVTAKAFYYSGAHADTESPVFIQDMTKMKVTTSTAASSCASITSVDIRCPKIGFYKIIKPSGSTSNDSAMSGLIRASGSCEISVTVTDTRGRSTTKNITSTVQPYYTPSVTSFVANRCTSDGTIATNGTYVKAKAAFSPCSVSGVTNTCTAKLYYKVNGQSSYTEYGSITSNTYTGAMGSGNFDMAHSHSVKLVVTDTLGGVTTRYINILGTSYIIDVLNGGTGLGIGCEASTQNQLDIGYATLFKDKVTFNSSPYVNANIYMKNNTYLCWYNSSGNSAFQVGLSSSNNAHLFSQNNYSGSLNIGHSANSGTFITGKGGSNITLTSDGKNQIYSKAIYDRTYSSGATVTVTEYGTLGRISSASKYKLDIRDIQEEAAYPYRILNLKLKQWFDKASCERYSEYLSNENSKPEIGCGIDSIYGLIAEDVEKAGLSKYCLYNPEGKIEGIQYERLWTLLIPIVDQNNRDIKKLLDIVKAQQEKIDTLTR